MGSPVDGSGSPKPATVVRFHQCPPERRNAKWHERRGDVHANEDIVTWPSPPWALEPGRCSWFESSLMPHAVAGYNSVDVLGVLAQQSERIKLDDSSQR